MSLSHVFAPSDFTYIIGELLNQTPDSFRIRYRTWFIRWIQVESSARTGAGNCPEFAFEYTQGVTTNRKSKKDIQQYKVQNLKTNNFPQNLHSTTNDYAIRNHPNMC